MGMIRFRVDFNGTTAHAIKGASDVGVKIGTNVIQQHTITILRGEDQMNVELGEGLRHGMWDVGR